MARFRLETFIAAPPERVFDWPGTWTTTSAPGRTPGRRSSEAVRAGSSGTEKRWSSRPGHRHHFHPVEGGTRRVDEWAHRAPLGWLGHVADWLFLTRLMRRLLETRNAALKQEAERGG